MHQLNVTLLWFSGKRKNEHLLVDWSQKLQCSEWQFGVSLEPQYLKKEKDPCREQRVHRERKCSTSTTCFWNIYYCSKGSVRFSKKNLIVLVSKEASTGGKDFYCYYTVYWSRDTEDWSNDAGNSALNILKYKTVSLNCNTISLHFCFQINKAFLSKKNLNKNFPNSDFWTASK